MDAEKTGNFIRTIRIEKNLTQKELADKLNCTDKAVSRWETGKGIPDISLLIPLSETLGVSVNEILNGEKIEAEKQIEKYEETIVNTLTDTKKQINKLNIVIYILFVVVEIFAIYFFTLCATPSDAMGLLLGLVLITQIISLLFGLTKIDFKYKTIFPWIVTVAFIPSNFIYWGSDALDVAFYYGLVHLAFSYIFILIGTGIAKLIQCIIKRRKKGRIRIS